MEQLVLSNGMIASGIVLAVTFIAIFTENLHGMERPKVAAGGAVLMVIVGQIYGFYSPEAAIEAVDWNVIFLLAAMMTVVSVMIPTGGFGWMAYKMAVFSRGRLYLMLVLLGTAVTVLSLLLDNVTTVVIFGPLIILIAQAQKVNPIPYLMAAALLSDTGGIASLVGDPPNLMIGSAADISFNTFIYRMGPPVIVTWLVVIVMLRFLFNKQLSEKPADIIHEEVKIKDPKLWRASLFVLGAMTILFILHSALHWEPWFVAVLGMTALVFASRHLLMDKAVEHVEVPLLIFFIGLFVVVGGVEHSEFLTYVGGFILPYAEADLLVATIILMWVAAFLSAAIDNIPFTAAMIPIILGMETQGINVAPMWWGLSMGVGLGGNGTHIGSTANVFIVTISERLARAENDPSLAITPGMWFRKGAPCMLVTLVVASIIFVLFFDWFSFPVN
jgi:Na+/H+ antiporter NhaD/arsenite permease-like protein